MPMVLAILLTLVLGALIGVINGVIVVRSGVHPMIVTLGVSQALNGISYPFLQRNSHLRVPGRLQASWDRGHLGVIPISLIIMVIIMIIGHFILSRLPYGRYLYAVGSNEEAAKLAGVNTGTVKMIAHTLSAFLTAIAADPASLQNQLRPVLKRRRIRVQCNHRLRAGRCQQPGRPRHHVPGSAGRADHGLFGERHDR